MPTNDPFREYRSFAKALNDIQQRLTGQQATVVSSNDHMVKVQTATSGGVIGPYPANVSDLAVGAAGVIFPLQDGNYMFIAFGGGTVIST